jgi:hypothetical protein
MGFGFVQRAFAQSADFEMKDGVLVKYRGNAAEVVIPDGVTSIGYEAFYGCTGLVSVTIPPSVTSIGFCVFSGCTGLVSVTIPEGVTSIDVGAFAFCTGLASVTIPDSASIGEGAFTGCPSLKPEVRADIEKRFGKSVFISPW